jgi:RNA polymerase sigma-70 factor (ECF subfamily)
VEFSRRNAGKQEIPLEDPDKPMPEVVSPDASADQTIQGTQVGAVLEKLITALPGKLSAPLILSAIEEMTPREIAATLDIKEAAVRSRVFRARQILKEKLAQRGQR